MEEYTEDMRESRYCAENGDTGMYRRYRNVQKIQEYTEKTGIYRRYRNIQKIILEIQKIIEVVHLNVR